MNKHFEDARYYLGRATEHAKEGVLEELEPIERRFKQLTGEAEQPQPPRRERHPGETPAPQARRRGAAKRRSPGGMAVVGNRAGAPSVYGLARSRWLSRAGGAAYRPNAPWPVPRGPSGTARAAP